MKRTSTLLIAFLLLGTTGCARRQTVDFAKELSRKITVGTSQKDAEKVLDQHGFTHSFDLKTHTIYAMKHVQQSGLFLVKEDWSAKIKLGEGQKVDSVQVKRVFTGP